MSGKNMRTLSIPIPRPVRAGECNPKCPIYGLEHEWLCPFHMHVPVPGVKNGWQRMMVPGPVCPWHKKEPAKEEKEA